MTAPRWEWLPADDGVRIEAGFDEPMPTRSPPPRQGRVRVGRWGLPCAQQVIAVPVAGQAIVGAADPRTVGSCPRRVRNSGARARRTCNLVAERARSSGRDHRVGVPSDLDGRRGTSACPAGTPSTARKRRPLAEGERVRLRIGNLAKAVLVTGQAYQDPKDALNEFVSNAADDYAEASGSRRSYPRAAASQGRSGNDRRRRCRARDDPGSAPRDRPQPVRVGEGW